MSALMTKANILNKKTSDTHIPNAETISAMRETDEHLYQLETGKVKPRFNNLAEFFISLLSEEC